MDDLTAEMVALYQRGYSVSEVAYLTNRSTYGVRCRLRKAKVKMRARGGSARHFGAVQSAEIVRLYRGGMSAVELGDQYETSSTTIYRILDRYGVTRRRPGRRKATA